MTEVDVPPLILHVIHHLVIGGMENGLVNLVNRMPETRFRHAIACVEDYSDFRNRLRRRDVEVYPLYRSRIGIWRTRRAIFRLCRRIRPAIVHTRNLSGLDALLPARLAGVRHCVHGEHGWDMSDLAGAHWKPALLRRLHAPLVSRYIAVSRDLQRYLIERIGIAPKGISQIYNGVDTARFVPVVQRPADVLPEDFGGEGRIVIGTVGRIQAVKDQATLVRAFAELRHRNPDLCARLRLVIVGEGPLLAELRRLVKDLELEPFAWLPGSMSDVPRVLQTFDVFALPSLNEGISNTTLEAMASGLPIAATAVGGNVEIIENGRTGRLFPPRDIETLVRILSEYVRDAALRSLDAQAARRAAVERFSLDTMVSQYDAVYTALCSGDRASTDVETLPAAGRSAG